MSWVRVYDLHKWDLLGRYLGGGSTKRTSRRPNLQALRPAKETEQEDVQSSCHRAELYQPGLTYHPTPSTKDAQE